MILGRNLGWWHRSEFGLVAVVGVWVDRLVGFGLIIWVGVCLAFGSDLGSV